MSKSTRLMLLPFCTGRQWLREDGKIMAQHTKRPYTSKRWEAFLLLRMKIRIQNSEITPSKEPGRKGMWKKTHTQNFDKRENNVAPWMCFCTEKMCTEKQEMFYCWCPVSEGSEVGFVALDFTHTDWCCQFVQGLVAITLTLGQKKALGQRWRHL